MDVSTVNISIEEKVKITSFTMAWLKYFYILYNVSSKKKNLYHNLYGKFRPGLHFIILLVQAF